MSHILCLSLLHINCFYLWGVIFDSIVFAKYTYIYVFLPMSYLKSKVLSYVKDYNLSDEVLFPCPCQKLKAEVSKNPIGND